MTKVTIELTKDEVRSLMHCTNIAYIEAVREQQQASDRGDFKSAKIWSDITNERYELSQRIQVIANSNGVD